MMTNFRMQEKEINCILYWTMKLLNISWQQDARLSVIMYTCNVRIHLNDNNGLTTVLEGLYYYNPIGEISKSREIGADGGGDARIPRPAELYQKLK